LHCEIRRSSAFTSVNGESEKLLCVEVSGKPVLMPFLKTNPVHPDMLDRFLVSSTHSPVIYSGQGNHVTARLLLIFAISFYATAIEKILRTTRIVLHHSIQVDGVKMFRQIRHCWHEARNLSAFSVHPSTSPGKKFCLGEQHWSAARK
jgi:hypothetical protein